MIRATKSGTYTSTLSDGQTGSQTINVPEKYDITGWDVIVESWNKGNRIERTENVLGVTPTEYTFDTAKTQILAKLHKTTTWDHIAEIGKNVSGKGTYTAEFNWDGSADGAYLDFGGLTQAMKIFINSTKTADININNPIIDISSYLVTGKNTIELKYSSNLTNVLLDRKVISATSTGSWAGGWPGYFIDHRSYGPHTAIIVPYIDSALVLDSNLVLSTQAHNVQQDGYADITTEFIDKVNSNTAVLNYSFDTELFEMADFQPADGITIISKEATENGAKVVMMVGNYDTRSYGQLVIHVKADAKLSNGRATVNADVEYVVKDENGDKAIQHATAATTFTTRGNGTTEPVISGDTNGDGIVNLIDLSNMIDWFGISSNHMDWNEIYTYFDFNNNGEIDISDISYVASLCV